LLLRAWETGVFCEYAITIALQVLSAYRLALMCRSGELIVDQQLSGMRWSSAVLVCSGIELGARISAYQVVAANQVEYRSVAAGIQL
jgi:hypothetical protein